ncbi:unnamed protein product [Didymodactylos carnosus]|uniref:Uncharacterized protein n=2 Tax=Didymodactylos carnosus TaxID=1234261 RepID=A0A8S2KFF4_9BILA|nr:unnamed protein product [Didymodactylos carnosus]CAF3848897.1 unnamed protein product [Didymodactylos carnosus]
MLPQRCGLCYEQCDHVLCTGYATLSRYEIFTTCLSKINAATVNFREMKDACTKLVPVIQHFAFDFNPLTEFDPTVHKQDRKAQEYIAYCEDMSDDPNDQKLFSDIYGIYLHRDLCRW